MTEPKKFQKGSHSYTKWGTHHKVVQVEKKKSKNKNQENELESKDDVVIDFDDPVKEGVYSNGTRIYKSSDEVIIDFLFLQHNQRKARVRSRVIMSYKQLQNFYSAVSVALKD